MLEAQQGDRISGKISRKEVASVAVAALGTEASVGKGLGLSGPCMYSTSEELTASSARPQHRAADSVAVASDTSQLPMSGCSANAGATAVCRKDA